MPDSNGKPLRSDADTPNPLINNVTYDVIKNLLIVAFPLFVTAYAGLGSIFGWPDVEKWVAAGGVIGVLFAGLVKTAEAIYNKLPVKYDGVLVANDPDPNNETYRLAFENGLPTMAQQDEVRLKVVDLLPPEERGI